VIDDDALQARIAREVRDVLLRLGGFEVAGATRHIVDAVMPLVTTAQPEALPDPALLRERYARRRQDALSIMARYEAEGRGGDAARLAAVELADNPRNPREVEHLAQTCRRWRRKEGEPRSSTRRARG
jgi:hypothetical protein